MRAVASLGLLTVIAFEANAVAQCGVGDIQKIVPAGTVAGDWVTHPSIDGEWMVIGAPFGDTTVANSGAAYVYHLNSSGAWKQTAQLSASDAGPGDWFGKHVAIRGDRIVVGATQEWLGGPTGKAYIFHHDGTDWVQEAKLVPSNSPFDGRFGSGVSLDGDHVIVGAYKAFGRGRAYIYHLEQGLWVEQEVLESPDPCSNDSFASHSVNVRGDVALVGSRYDSQLGTTAGAVFVFRRYGEAWVFDQKLLASDGGAGDTFGWWLDFDGEQIIVGAPSPSGGPGAAYVFAPSGPIWEQVAKLTSPSPHGGDNFGYYVAIRDRWAAVGARFGDAAGVNTGEVALFSKSQGQWALLTSVIPDGLDSGDEYSNVSLGDEVMAIGALGDDDAGENGGAVYVVDLPGDNPRALFTATPLSGKVPLTVQFQDESIGEVTSWQWDFGNGYSSTIRSPLFTFNEVGSFYVTLSVSGPCGTSVYMMDEPIQVRARIPYAQRSP